jgi:hypothetical protein
MVMNMIKIKLITSQPVLSYRRDGRQTRHNMWDFAEKKKTFVPLDDTPPKVYSPFCVNRIQAIRDLRCVDCFFFK